MLNDWLRCFGFKNPRFYFISRGFVVNHNDFFAQLAVSPLEPFSEFLNGCRN